VLDALRIHAKRLEPDSVWIPRGTAVALLHPHRGSGDEATRAHAWFEAVVTGARRLAPASGAQAVAAAAPAPLALLGGRLRGLADLSELQSDAGRERPVVNEREMPLQRLLRDHLDRAGAAAFLDELLGRLDAWDREHRSGLLQVLEAALDYPAHEEAAQRCFMHRNTFRRRLRRAVEILGVSLDDPDMRLALHVALKLRGLVAGGEAPGRARRAATGATGTANGRSPASGASRA
jgi:sugar diacid utilization regulator